MEKSFYKSVTDKVEELLLNNGYEKKSENDSEYYTGKGNAFVVEYNEQNKLLELKVAAISGEEEESAFRVMSSWLLTDESDERDLKSIGNDFEDSLSEFIGIKTSTVQNRNNVVMPTKQAKADTVDIGAMAARFLSIYPAHKDDYKTNVSTYGEFLYDDFFSKYATVEFATVLKSDEKKRINKMLDWLYECYIKGDDNVVNAVMYSVIAQTLVNNPEVEKTFDQYVVADKYKYLKDAKFGVMNFIKKGTNAKKYLG